MMTILQFAILGLGLGAAYAVLANGLVLIYRGSGVVNLGHGAMAMIGAFIYWQFSWVGGWPAPVAALAAVAVTAILGALVYVAVVWPLRGATPMTRIVATLGVLLGLQGVALLVWGPFPKTVSSVLGVSAPLRVGDLSVGGDEVILFAVAAVLAVGLPLIFRHTSLGLAIQAMQQNRRAAAAFGWSPFLIGGSTWIAGGALAGLAGVLIAPLGGASVETMPLLVVPALAAALFGRMTGFVLTTVGALAIGVLQSEAIRFVDIPGIAEAVPFLFIVLVVIVRRTSVGTRSQARLRLPVVGTGRVPIGLVAVAVVAYAALTLFVFPTDLVVALTNTTVMGIVLLSIVLLLGYAGQMSLAQLTIGGIAALIAGRLVADWGWPFEAAIIVAIVASVAIGLVFAIPALRSEGISLAIVTLGLATVVSAMIFNNVALTGGSEGTRVGRQTLFGIDIDAFSQPRTYAMVALVALVLCSVVVANIRRGGSGRRLIAVRTNERAAAALGINIVEAKLFAFAVAAAIAAAGGILLGFRSETILYSHFGASASIFSLGYAVIGGVGFIFGGPVGATLSEGSFGSWLIEVIAPGASFAWLQLVAGLVIIIVTIFNPDGVVGAQVREFLRIRGRIEQRRARKAEHTASAAAAPEVADVTGPDEFHTPAKTLIIEDVSVRFGGVRALRGVSLRVNPGEVLGLIGPNGAGKTTLIDAISGFVPVSSGSITLNGDRMERERAYQRTRRGVSRSFQSLELFEDGSVLENLAVATDASARSGYLSDWIVPRKPTLGVAARAAVREFRLGPYLRQPVSGLPYGIRRLVAITRAIATQPSVLLLDEPAAGLSDIETTELGSIVRRLAHEWGFGVLVIEHDMSFVSDVCDRVVVLDFGSVIASGTVADVKSDPAVIAAYLGVDDAGPALEGEEVLR